MARSILPSTSRSSTWAQTAVRRANRRWVAQQLRVSGLVHDDPDDWDDRLDGVDIRHYPAAAIARIVWWRRGCDKLNHFERWAVRVTRDIPVEDRLGAMRAMLPAGLVGSHALSHLALLPELDPHWRDPRAGWRAKQAAAAAAEQARLADLRARVHDALRNGGHRDLNRAMKAAACGDPPRWRTVAHAGDVAAFVADVTRHRCWAAALDRFLAGGPTRRQE